VTGALGSGTKAEVTTPAPSVPAAWVLVVSVASEASLSTGLGEPATSAAANLWDGPSVGAFVLIRDEEL
jgi:hypothetical protein